MVETGVSEADEEKKLVVASVASMVRAGLERGGWFTGTNKQRKQTNKKSHNKNTCHNKQQLAAHAIACEYSNNMNSDSMIILPQPGKLTYVDTGNCISRIKAIHAYR